MKKAIIIVLVLTITLLMASTAMAAGGQIGAFTYELKGNGTAIITDFDWDKHTGGDVYVPRAVDGYQVTEIGPMAFSNEEAGIVEKQYTPITSYPWEEYRINGVGEAVAIVLLDTITVIAEKAFFCTNIASCDIPASVQLIGSGAFAGCPNIRQFSVNSQNRTFAVIDGVLFNKVKKELVAFPYAYNTADYTIPNGIKSIGDYAFYGYGLTTQVAETVRFAETITEIGDYAFYHSLIHALFSNSIKEIGQYTFALSEIRVLNESGMLCPEKVGAYAFLNCTEDEWDSTRNLWISLENTREIGEGAFSHFDLNKPGTFFNTIADSQITIVSAKTFEGFALSGSSYTLPNTLVEIGESAFADTEGLDVVIPANVTTISKRAFNNASQLNISFAPESKLCKIDDEAFLGAQMKNATLALPDGLEELGYRSLYAYALNKVIVPESVTTIGDEVVNRSYIVLQVVPGSYADLWASENGYPMETNDNSWLFE